MIEIDFKESKKTNKLYNTIKDLILSKKENQSFYYSHKQHHLYEESEFPGISRNYYNEKGTVEFENTHGKIIKLTIYRWHPHKHNGWSGLNGNPCLEAKIFIKDGDEEQLLWELKVGSGTLYYKAEVSSLDIPFEELEEKIEILPEIVIEEQKEENIQIQEVKPQETRNLFEEIVNLYNKYKSKEQKKEELLLSQQKKIEEATKSIISSYSIKIKQKDSEIKESKQELNKFDKLFEKYSTFDIDMLGNTFQQLITLVEGEEFVYKKLTHNFKKRVHGVMDSWDEDVQTKVKLIVNKNKLTELNNNSYEKENKLVKNGEVILLSEQDTSNKNNKKIPLYTSQDGQVLCSIDFGRFDYIKEFIYSIIQYRFQNDITEFKEKDMLPFMQKFIIDYKETIIKNYDSKIQKKILELTLNDSD